MEYKIRAYHYTEGGALTEEFDDFYYSDFNEAYKKHRELEAELFPETGWRKYKVNFCVRTWKILSASELSILNDIFTYSAD